MSRFDYNYLNENVRVGFSATRGPAWWSQFAGADSSHFEGAVPIEEARRLFDWEPVKRALMVEGDDGLATPLKDYRGSAPVAITHSRTGHLIGIMGENYPTTGYNTRLLDGLVTLLDTPDTELSIGSIGTLDGGSQGWVQLETPELMEHSSGEKFKPFLSAYTSLDGSLSTTFMEGVNRWVCDNTFEAGRKDKSGSRYSYKNTSNSKLVVATARDALDLLQGTAENYMAELDSHTTTRVSDKQWAAIVEMIVPHTDDKGNLKEGRAKTIADGKHDILNMIYHTDKRVGSFEGTRWGAFQAFSTWNQHEAGGLGKDDNEFQRNMRKSLSGDTAKFDSRVMEAIGAVLNR